MKSTTSLGTDDTALMQALLQRQTALAQPLLDEGQLLRLHANSTAPFTTGLGNAHPLENGFAFLNPYGLPYLAGSGVKGVLRNAARELLDGVWDRPTAWSAERRHRSVSAQGAELTLSDIDVLFGSNGDSALAGVTTFWDVYPESDRLQVEIMTPHQKHYYEGAGKLPPHESGQPTPILFLAVPPQARFCFNVRCDRPRLEKLAPELAKEDKWKTLLSEAFSLAFDWLGFGAKTAVGYGALSLDEQRGRKEASEWREQERKATLSPLELELEDWVTKRRQHVDAGYAKQKLHAQFHQEARALWNKTTQSPEASDELRQKVADAIRHWLPQVVEMGANKKKVLKKMGLP